MTDPHSYLVQATNRHDWLQSLRRYSGEEVCVTDRYFGRGTDKIKDTGGYRAGRYCPTCGRRLRPLSQALNEAHKALAWARTAEQPSGGTDHGAVSASRQDPV